MNIGFKEGEVNALFSEFVQISKNVRRDRMAILTASSKILVNEVKSRAPVGSVIHKRYSTPKINKLRRAKRGSGVVVATYMPGNLRFSIKTMRFKQSKSAVFVGALLQKGRGGGIHNSSANTDGYYAHMIERGTKKTNERPFIAPAVSAVGGDVRDDMIKRLQNKIKRLKR